MECERDLIMRNLRNPKEFVKGLGFMSLGCLIVPIFLFIHLLSKKNYEAFDLVILIVAISFLENFAKEYAITYEIREREKRTRAIINDTASMEKKREKTLAMLKRWDEKHLKKI